jgi:hypothetical protein
MSDAVQFSRVLDKIKNMQAKEKDKGKKHAPVGSYKIVRNKIKAFLLEEHMTLDVFLEFIDVRDLCILFLYRLN